MQLYDFQKTAVDVIASNGHQSYLGYEMGLGKSIIALMVARQRGVKRLLIFCPAVGKLVWKRECARWWPGMPVTIVETWRDVQSMNADGIYLVTYNRISMSKSSGYDMVEGLLKHVKKPFDMSVLDEAHYLKNPKSIRTASVLKKLKPILGWCLPMSGTPAPNHAGELFPILSALFPEAIRKSDGRVMKQYEYEATFCDVVPKYFNGRTVQVIEGSKNLDKLRQRMAPFMLRKRKSEVLKSLPDMTFDTFPIDAPGAPAWRTDWNDVSMEDFIDTLMRDEHIMRLRKELGVAKVPGACEAITTMLEGCTRKVLVFAIHHEVIDQLMTGLAAFSPTKIDGRDLLRHRDQAINRFLTDPNCRVFVGNIQAAGTSITLVGPGCNVSDVFFVEADFSPGNNVQAASRIHRIGQKDAVQVWFLSAAGTYDDRIADILARKSADFQQLFG